jgi:hypothetical protein
MAILGEKSHGQQFKLLERLNTSNFYKFIKFKIKLGIT